MKKYNKNYDIIYLDKKIQGILLKEKCNINKYIKKLNILEKKVKKITRYNELNKLNQEIFDLVAKIREIEFDIPYSLYLSRTHVIIKTYKEVLNTAMPCEFMLNNEKENVSILNFNQDKLIKEFIDIAQEYIKIDSIYSLENKRNLKKCTACGCDDVDELENICICTHCGKEIVLLSTKSSFKDIDRINITTKYKYDKISHFKDIIYKYQAKQTNTIPEKLYIDIKLQLKLHGLILNDVSSSIKTPAGTKKLKYKKVTKKHIFMFLKETGYSEYYDDSTLIYCTITGASPPDVSYIENELIEDFKLLIQTYNLLYKDNTQIKTKRKNFLNSQYILFQLLKKYNYKCKKEDFNILRTRERRQEHDDIYSKLCNYLQWSWVNIV